MKPLADYVITHLLSYNICDPKYFLDSTVNMPVPSVPGVVSFSKAAKHSRLIMRFQQWGCNNRPFYHIVVDKMSHPNRRQIDPIEQVGTYDPMTNAHNEKLVSLNLERIQSYIAGGVTLSR